MTLVTLPEVAAVPGMSYVAARKSFRIPATPGRLPGLKAHVVSRTSFDFHRQRIVVADDESPTIARVIDILRRDGHSVSHAGDAGSAGLDLALRHCHLFICGSGIGGVSAIDLIGDVRERMPGLAILCLADAIRWTPRLMARLPVDVTILREPFTAEALRAAVRPLLPQLSFGTTLAWLAEVSPATGR